MPSAVCPYCQEMAFSSVEFTKVWTCPNCSRQVEPEPKRPAKGTVLAGAGTDAQSRDARYDARIEQYAQFWTKHE